MKISRGSILKKSIVMAMCAVVSFAGLTGCETVDNFMKSFKKNDLKKGVHHRLSVHQIVKYPRATKLEKALPTVDGTRKVWVNMNYFMDSRTIKDIKLVKVEDKVGLYNFSIQLDDRGVFQWLQLSNGFFETPLALVCDGKVLKIFTIKERSTEESEWVTLEGPFDFVKSKLIQKYAAHNYKFYND